MKLQHLVAAVIAAGVSSGVAATDRVWENPVFDTEAEAVAAARKIVSQPGGEMSPAQRFFVDLTLAEGDLNWRHSSSTTSRQMVEDILITHPTAFANNAPQRQTIERFVAEIPRQQAVLEKRLARFGYPESPGLVYCGLVDSVDAFAGLNRASSDKMSQVGGVTYYCRYVILPLSYVGEQNVRELRRSAARNASVNVDDTIRRWQRESYANLVNTFRHELVHVRTNSSLGVPSYSDRTAYPTWFHEGSATYLAADPRSGLSKGYQEYQELFFYLAQRHGIPSLQKFYADIFGGADVKTALTDVYSISGTDELFTRSSRWHRVNEAIKTGLWVIVLAMIIAAFRGVDRPFIGDFQLLIAFALMLAAATGLAEHLYGLRGPGVVSAVKVGLALTGVVIGGLGLRRVLRHRNRQAESI